MTLRSCGLAEWQAMRVRRYIDEHITETIRVRDLGRIAGLSGTHFTRLFRRTFKQAPYMYVMQQRTARAAQIMLQRPVPLTEVAQLCGFFDQAHFSRIFRRLVGQTPSAWRRERMRVDHARPHSQLPVVLTNNRCPLM